MVVFPLPVGPVTRIIPYGAETIGRNADSVSGEKPSVSMFNGTVAWSRMRITTLSPCSVGIVETRKSISFPPIRSFTRPSCGSRLSAMFSRAMILIRERIAVWSRRGGDSTSSRIPSIRYRTRSAFSYGSKWMSLAPRSIARAMTKLTSRMMGASEATPISCSTRSSPATSGASSPTCSTRLSIEEPASPYPFSIASRISSSVPAITSTRFPVALATASLAFASRGSAIATVSVPSAADTGIRSLARRKESGRTSEGAGASASGSRRNAGIPQIAS